MRFTPKRSLAHPSLRALLTGNSLSILIEAHDTLSAQIATEAGAPGLWASSLTLSCARGLRDNSELTMSEALDALERMTERVDAPILFDGDTGYGQFSHFQILVRRLETRRVAGVCIEDKIFPKENSFINSEGQTLAPVAEFCGKLRAGADARGSREFVIVARTEALVTGLGMAEAIDRAEAYFEAGADAILVHSRAPTASEVIEFGRRWSGRAPLICVPTTYYSTQGPALFAAGYAVAIAANQMMRASIRAMQAASARIVAAQSVRDVEESIAPLSEIFRLQDAFSPGEAEERYARTASRRAVILAASRGERLGSLTEARPKCLIPVGGVSVLDRMLTHLRAEEVRNIAVVRGYRAASVTPSGVRFFDNPRFAETGEVASLAAAAEFLEGDVLVAYGDLLIKRYILHQVLSSDGPITIVADSSGDFASRGNPEDRILATSPPLEVTDEGPILLRAVGSHLAVQDAHGEWIGLARVRPSGMPDFRRAMDEVLAQRDGATRAMDAVFAQLLKNGVEVRVLYIHRDWADIDDVADLVQREVE